jgi:uncharacterized membrane protein YdjX (TVP38/TMEM64 family)
MILREDPNVSHAHAVPAGASRSSIWIRVAIFLALGLLVAAAWQWTPLRTYLDPEWLSDFAEPWRDAWYAGLLLLALYLVLELCLFPLSVLVVVTGVAFGPWLGSAYALAGTMASAAMGFGLGRRLGRKRVSKLLGPRATRFDGAISRNGILAVFMLRKIPFPYTLANLAMGASAIRFRDFMMGTLLGLGSMVVVAAILGHELAAVHRDPSARTILLAVALLVVPFGIAWFLNRRAREAKP